MVRNPGLIRAGFGTIHIPPHQYLHLKNDTPVHAREALSGNGGVLVAIPAQNRSRKDTFHDL